MTTPDPASTTTAPTPVPQAPAEDPGQHPSSVSGGSSSQVVRRAAAKANRRRGGDIRVTLSPVTVGCTSGFGGWLRLEPGEHINEHYHPYSEEFIHVVSGSVEMTVEGVVHPMTADDSLIVPTGQRHRLFNTGATPAEAVFHLSPLAPRPELGHVDTEPVRDPTAPGPVVGGVS